MKTVLVVLVILCMVMGCSSTAPSSTPPTHSGVNQTQAATTPMAFMSPVTTLTQDTPTIPATIPLTIQTTLPPTDPKTTTIPPSPAPAISLSLVAGDYCSYPVCDLPDSECLRMQNQYGTLNTCMHLSMSGEVSMWRQHARNLASPSGYRITGDELVLGIPNGWRIVSFESSSVIYNSCSAGSCNRILDSVRCRANGTVISCFSDAFVYVRVGQDQL